jgi:hypothetical protein
VHGLHANSQAYRRDGMVQVPVFPSGTMIESSPDRRSSELLAEYPSWHWVGLTHHVTALGHLSTRVPDPAERQICSPSPKLCPPRTDPLVILHDFGSVDPGTLLL